MLIKKKIPAITLLYCTTKMSHVVQGYLPLGFLGFLVSPFNRFLSSHFPSVCHCSLPLMLVSLSTALLFSNQMWVWKLYSHVCSKCTHYKAYHFWVRNSPLSNTFLLLGMISGSIYDSYCFQLFFTSFWLFSEEDTFLNNWTSQRCGPFCSEYCPPGVICCSAGL